MNYTNFTTEKPVVYEQASASTFGSGRDIAYLVFSILQFLVTVFALILVHHIMRNKDKKDEKERLEKEERDKIADIIDKEYNKIVEDGVVENLRKCRSKFQAMVMFYGSAWETHGRKYKITGLDVLRFMLLNFEDFEGELLRKLKQNLDAVVRLFLSLRIKLPLRVDCPENIKEELGPLITDIGEITRSFVSASKRYTIANVLKYFGNARVIRSKRNEESQDEDDNRKVRRIFPYLSILSFGIKTSEVTGGRCYFVEGSTYHDQDFDFEINSAGIDQKQVDVITDLRIIKTELCNKMKPIIAENLRSFPEKIDAIWKRKFHQLPMPDWSKEEHLRANILHVVHVFIFKLMGDSDIIHDEKIGELVDEMKNKIYVVGSGVEKYRSKRLIEDIHSSLEQLRQYPHLCEQKSITNMLEQVHKNINASMRQALYNP